MEGLVQGVGFRPFVYTLALSHALSGFVLNSPEGVSIEVEGDEAKIDAFEQDLKTSLPPLARIDLLQKTLKPLENSTVFEIRQSLHTGAKHSAVLPDMALCEDCAQEMADPSNHRYGYAFTNCTNCGPRYSIIRTVPYDRPNTSMEPFIMCALCQAEYDNPLDRRYHAQPISCPHCGPTLSLHRMSDGATLVEGDEAIEALAQYLCAGNIVAMKGMGGFHLMCDGENAQAVALLRARKQRPTKPFALMCKDIKTIHSHALLSEHEETMVCSIQKPIVLVKKRATSTLPEIIAPHTDRLGLFLPYTPLHVKLFSFLNGCIVATSANRSGEPIVESAELLREKLAGVVDVYLDYNREIVNASDDSVVQLVGDRPVLLRASRGLTPQTFQTKSQCKQTILAVGAEQKNAIALFYEGKIIQSPYIGDMHTLETFGFFEKTLGTLERFYGVKCDAIVCDKHPYYATSQWAKVQGVPVHTVQHHHAHIRAVMFEHGLEGPVLGVAWDGTGYGDDGTIWGGEFLRCEGKAYARVAHFKPFKLLGGDASTKDIWRILFTIFCDIPEEKWHLHVKRLFGNVPKNKQAVLKKLHQKGLNSPYCSSVGRLFDAVAALAFGLEKVSYDGESGLLVERAVKPEYLEAYPFTCKEGVIDYEEVFLAMLEDDKEQICTKFINGLVCCIIDVAKKEKLPLVIGGGVFQNKTLLERLIIATKKENIPLYFPQKITPNDGAIAIGQLMQHI
ncbi:carbamoyltransferase HypF [Sulfurospirillum tamanense]|uniref:carbamoyltransferase HypF n=1 Tax=Sulfurospirillum tamanense TaxID=2813362 RepID=UPI0034E1F1C3